jgi:SAM-dependent methyltransferase
VKPAALERLRCPSCHARQSFELSAYARSGESEVREGTLTCRSCGDQRSVSAGIVDLLPADLPPFVSAEAAGLDRFVNTMHDYGWTREDILALPFREDGYWFCQARAMQQTLATTALGLAPGKTILDVGSNTCWASAMLAENDLDVTALDINANQMQGLRTADWWFEAKDIYFERVLGVMFDLPFADGVFDYVWCCEVLHHNHRANLYRTMRELARVLKPGGRAIVVNETCRSLRDPKWRPGHEVAQFDGHEHAYLPWSYVHAARRAGLQVQVVYPWTVPMFSPTTFELQPETSLRRAAWLLTVHTTRRLPALRRAALAYKHYIDGAASVYMIATNPGQAS